MRVLQAMAGAEFGGAEAFFVRLATALQKTEVEQHVVIRDNLQRARYLRGQGVKVTELPFGGKLDFRTGRGLKREIRDFKPDVVLTWMNRATDKCPSGDFVKVARLGGYYDLKYYQDCDYLIGNTEDICRYLVKQGWPEDKAVYLPNFVSQEKAEPERRADFYTPDSAPLLLALGRLHTNKAFDTLIKALGRVPEAYLWIAGGGPEREALETLAEKEGVRPRVRFLGWREDIAALYAAADIFVCPSRHEPLGNVVIEGWAQNKPVIAADALGPGTLIEHGQTGILFPVDDVRALGDAIEYTIGMPDEAQRMADAGRNVFEEHFTEDVVVKHYLDFFEKVAG